MSDYDNVTKLALLIDADNAQLSVINFVLPEIWHSSCEAGIDPSRYPISSGNVDAVGLNTERHKFSYEQPFSLSDSTWEIRYITAHRFDASWMHHR